LLLVDGVRFLHDSRRKMERGMGHCRAGPMRQRGIRRKEACCAGLLGQGRRVGRGERWAERGEARGRGRNQAFGPDLGRLSPLFFISNFFSVYFSKTLFK